MRRHALVASILLGLVSYAAPAAAQTVTVVAVTGKKAPGLPRKLASVDFPYVGPHGEVAFTGSLVGDEGSSLFERRGKRLRVVARANRRAAGMPPGIVYWGPTPLGFDDLGRLYFTGVSGPKNPLAYGFGFAVWRTTADGKGVELLLREGQGIPAIGVLGEPTEVTLGPAGHVAYRYADVERILVRSPEGALSVAMWETTPLPDLPPGYTFVTFGHMVLDASGGLLFEVWLHDTVNDVTGLGVWRRRATGELEAVAVPGSSPPGAGGRTLVKAYLQRGGSSGMMAAVGEFAEEIEPGDLACALEAAPESPAAVTAQAATTPPGVPPEYRIGTFAHGWVDDASRVFFDLGLYTTGGETLPGSQGVWQSEGGALVPVAVPGGAVAGDPPRTLAAPWSFFYGRSGTILFAATLDGDATGSLLGVPSAGGLPVLLRTAGDTIQVGASAFEATYLLPPLDPSTHRTPVDADRVAVKATYSDAVQARQAIVVIDLPTP